VEDTKKEGWSPLTKIASALVISSVILAGLYEPVIVYPDGILVQNEPLQENITPPYEFSAKNYKITVLAEFVMEGKALSKERYRLGTLADLVPYDFAMGLKEMSDESNLREIAISQEGRWYYWTVNENSKLDYNQIGYNSANMHMSPVGDEVRNRLDEVRRGDIISLSGKLINITDDKGRIWKSSLSRTDTGAGACEIILVDKITIK